MHGVPATSSIAPSISKSAIAVPRSGSASEQHARRRPRAARSGARAAGACAAAGGARGSAAAQTASASFASSDGWKTAGPIEIQRRAPLTARPDHEHGGEQGERDDARAPARARAAGGSPSAERPPSGRSRAPRRSPAARRRSSGCRRRPRPAPRSPSRRITIPNATSASVTRIRILDSSSPRLIRTGFARGPRFLAGAEISARLSRRRTTTGRLAAVALTPVVGRERHPAGEPLAAIRARGRRTGSRSAA